MRVKVYFNLHKKLFSVVAMEGPNKGRVINHLSELRLEECDFRVQKAGRERVIAEGRKNVHAYVVGRISDQPFDISLFDEEVTYNPYKYSTFVDKHSCSPVFKRSLCKFVSKNGRAKIFSFNNENQT